MKKEYKYLSVCLGSVVYGVLLIIMSRFLLIHLGSLFYAIGKMTNIDGEMLIHITRVLDQLNTAVIVSPWVLVLSIGIIIGVLYYRVIHQWKYKKVFSICLWFVLFVPLMLIVVCFTEVNDVRVANVWLAKNKTSEYSIETYDSEGENWNFGFGRKQIIPDEESSEPLYIAGYNNGVEITGVLDYCEARAVWVDTGAEGVLIIGIDCVALDSSTVHKIREALSDIDNCVSINVFSTHTHAGIDTLGMWGPIGIDGKNEAYMKNLIKSAEEAGREAAANRTAGTLYLGQVKTDEMYRDSRDPQVYDENLYQLRFAAKDKDITGLRLYFYGAHAESLRGDNKQLSRDYPGMLCDKVTEITGDDTMFFPGAIGGLIMTKEFTDTNMNAVKNMEITADKLVDYALSITEEMEQELFPNMTFARTKCVVPMDNTAFWLYKFLGILNNKLALADSSTGCGAETELAVMMLGDLAVTLIPGEIFPELVLGGEYGDVSSENKNPEPLCQIAANYGIKHMLVVGLANDEIGYIVPPSDFLLNSEMPYLEKTMDYKGENHYEETNSIGFSCAYVIADAFEKVVEGLE